MEKDSSRGVFELHRNLFFNHQTNFAKGFFRNFLISEIRKATNFKARLTFKKHIHMWPDSFTNRFRKMYFILNYLFSLYFTY